MSSDISAQANSSAPDDSSNSTTVDDSTQTSKFSKELFSTVAALNQAGPLSQDSVDQLSASLADKIGNPVVRKTFVLSDLKVSTDNSVKAYTAYNTSLNNIYKNHPTKKTVMDVLQEFINDGQNVNADALTELDPIIEQTTSILNDMTKVSVPSDLASAHLAVINDLEMLIENTTDIELYDSDPVLAMGAMSKYQDNTDLMQTSMQNLISKLSLKLNN